MTDTNEHASKRLSASARPNGGRRLIAGLRVTAHDEALLAVVRPYLPDAESEGELAYRLWRRGLDVTLAEVVGLGSTPPGGMTEEILAGLVAQRLLLCLPLLRRTGTLALLGLDAAPQERHILAEHHQPGNRAPADTIETGAADAIAALGGNDFL